jgi:uncharacterized protein (DUF736 family)
MAKEFDNRNRGALFKNEEKDGENDREYSGTLNIEGAEYWLSGWVRVSKNGRKYLSLSLKPKQDKPPATNKSRADDFDDMISF